MSLASRLKRSILKLAATARQKTTRTRGGAAIAVLRHDPLMAGPRTAEQRDVVGAFLRRLAWFRKVATDEQLLDFCTYGVADEYADGATVLELGAEAVFVLVLRGKATVMQRSNAKVPARVLFEGDCENETYLDQALRGSQNSPTSIVAAEDGTVLLRMSRAWLKATDFLNTCRTVGIDLRNPVYDRTTFLGRIPERNLERLLRRSRVRHFSARHVVLDATHAAAPTGGGGGGAAAAGSAAESSGSGGGGVGSSSSTTTTTTNSNRGGGGHSLSSWSSSSPASAAGTGGSAVPGATDEVLYIADGTVQVTWVFREGDSVWYVPVATFGAREVVGLLEVLYHLPVSYQVLATTPVKVLCIPREALTQISASDLRLAEDLSFEMWRSWVDRLLHVLHTSSSGGLATEKALQQLEQDLGAAAGGRGKGPAPIAAERSSHRRKERGFVFSKAKARTMCNQIGTIKGFLLSARKKSAGKGRQESSSRRNSPTARDRQGSGGGASGSGKGGGDSDGGSAAGGNNNTRSRSSSPAPGQAKLDVDDAVDTSSPVHIMHKATSTYAEAPRLPPLSPNRRAKAAASSPSPGEVLSAAASPSSTRNVVPLPSVLVGSATAAALQ